MTPHGAKSQAKIALPASSSRPLLFSEMLREVMVGLWSGLPSFPGDEQCFSFDLSLLAFFA